MRHKEEDREPSWSRKSAARDEKEFAMQSGMVSLARWGVVIAIVVGLPLLAIPSVSRKVGSLLYGQSSDHLPPMAPGRAAEPVLAPQATSEHAPVSFEQPVEMAPPPSFSRQNGLDDRAVAPPPLEQRPSFPEPPRVQPMAEAPRRLPAPPAGAAPMQADWKDRVSAVRLQLERWGADYLLLESIGADNYRFHCRMAVAGVGNQTQSFEAMASDPAVAAEQVLDDVAAWRVTSRQGR
jgi:hypothetical protein